MIDFEKRDFDLQISLSPTIRVIVKSQYPVKRLKEIVDVTIGGTPSRRNNSYFQGQHLWVTIKDLNEDIVKETDEKITNLGIENSNVKKIPAKTTLLSFKLSIGKVGFTDKESYTNEAIAALIPLDKKEINDMFLFVLFKSRIINLQNIGNKAFGKSLNKSYLQNEVRIPVPPLDIQEEVVKEYEKLDTKSKKVRLSDKDYLQQIKDIFYTMKIVEEVNDEEK